MLEIIVYHNPLEAMIWSNPIALVPVVVGLLLAAWVATGVDHWFRKYFDRRYGIFYRTPRWATFVTVLSAVVTIITTVYGFSLL